MVELRSAVGALLTKKVDEFLGELRGVLLDELGVAVSPVALASHLLPPRVAVEKGATKALPSRRETTKPTKASTRSRKRQPDRERVESTGRGTATDLTGKRVGPYVGIESTGKKNKWGNILWRFRCNGCGTEKLWGSGMVSTYARKGLTPRCACSKAGASPKAERPTPAKPAPATKPEPVRGTAKPMEQPTAPTFTRRAPSTDLTGQTCGTFRAVGPTSDRRMGSIVWLFRCSDCSQERLWTKGQFATNRRRAVRCTCKGGSPASRTGRVPVRLTTPEEKPLDELDGDDLEREYLNELENDRSIPRIRTDEPERRAFDADPDAFDRPTSDDEDEVETTEELDFDEAAGGE